MIHTAEGKASKISEVQDASQEEHCFSILCNAETTTFSLAGILFPLLNLKYCVVLYVVSSYFLLAGQALCSLPVEAFVQFLVLFSPCRQRLHTGNSDSDGNYKVAVAFAECCFFPHLLKSLIRDLFQPYQNFIFVGGRFGQIGSVIIIHMEKMKEGNKIHKNTVLS